MTREVAPGRKGICLYGCDEPADFYPCGWRCAEHRPQKTDPK